MRANTERLHDLVEQGKLSEKDASRFTTRQARRRIVLSKPAIRSGSRTGTPAHFAAWKAEGQMKSALQRLRLDRLADALAEKDGRTNSETAQAFAILYTAGNGAFKTAWDVKTATLGALLAVPGIGPARVDRIEDYLRIQGVELDWQTED